MSSVFLHAKVVKYVGFIYFCSQNMAECKYSRHKFIDDGVMKRLLFTLLFGLALTSLHARSGGQPEHEVCNDRGASSSDNKAVYLLAVILVVGVQSVGAVWETNYRLYHRLKEKQARKQELARKHSQTMQQVEACQQKITELERQLATAIDDGKHKTLTGALECSPLYTRIRLHAGKDGFRLSAEEWKELGALIDRVYGQFTMRLLHLAKLTAEEVHVCYLLKMEIQPSGIAEMMCMSRSGITMLRQRLYKKLTQEKGTAKQFDEFILNF